MNRQVRERNEKVSRWLGYLLFGAFFMVMVPGIDWILALWLSLMAGCFWAFGHTQGMGDGYKLAVELAEARAEREGR